MLKIVVALGGNALGNTPNEQKEIVKETAKNLVDLISAGHKLVIVHGNGPQVGMINQAFNIANTYDKKSPLVDFPECGSMSQGYIGYHLQNAIKNEFEKRKMNSNNVITLVTQTKVSKEDSAFKNPTKPIGDFYEKQVALELKEKNNWDMIEDAGRGYRRVVASPKPVDIVEKDVIKYLLEKNVCVISGGGGGIPVIEENNQLQGVASVIDKDFAAAKIAEIIQADKLIILTAVNKVLINYGKENQTSLDSVTLKELEKYIGEHHFAPGSMLPKVQAAMEFVKNSGNQALIGSLTETKSVIEGKSGTIIKK
ncbi:carbamate kinase [Spiroplasma floricola]|uniref:Carbamate kinase n=1 Tax=Spiroplasma floricola 23-6 TaxID=1336749 RepID=A0A2K8SDJ6_9MOLU|nr:carbamate kinase [Spiroplasma floricola]AUB31529.1 carbamate kinase [Spiroplasma floricola 23-6]